MGKSRRHRKVSLRGWWRVLPFLLLPFLVFSYQAWLHTEILANQYEANDLIVLIREAEAANQDLSGAMQELEGIKRIDAKAPDLGLVEPNPGQRVLIAPTSGREVLSRETTVFRNDP